jgi:enterochelin esterase-like enzyme
MQRSSPTAGADAADRPQLAARATARFLVCALCAACAACAAGLEGEPDGGAPEEGEGEGEGGGEGEGEGEGDGEGDGEQEQAPASALLALLARLEALPSTERQAEVDRFFDERAAPWVEGELASFLFRSATARDVKVAGDHTGWDHAPERLTQVEGTNLFHRTMRLPVDARLDYQFKVDGEWRLDPENPHRCPSGFGENSELRMPEWVHPAAIDFQPGIAHGVVNGVTVRAEGGYPPERLASASLQNERDVWIYTPPAYDPAIAYPLLLVNDGGDYLRLAGMANVVDNLIDAGLIEPLVVAFVAPVERAREYVGARVPGYVAFVREELMPFVGARASIAADPGRRAVMGTSYGGYISMRLAHDAPELFGMFASQSGILLYDAGRALGGFGQEVPAPRRVWLDTGLIGDATLDSEAARDLFVDRGIEHAFLAVNEGHSWGSWRARLDDILRYLFPRAAP